MPPSTVLFYRYVKYEFLVASGVEVIREVYSRIFSTKCLSRLNNCFDYVSLRIGSSIYYNTYTKYSCFRFVDFSINLKSYCRSSLDVREEGSIGMKISGVTFETQFSWRARTCFCVKREWNFKQSRPRSKLIEASTKRNVGHATTPLSHLKQCSRIRVIFSNKHFVCIKKKTWRKHRVNTKLLFKIYVPLNYPIIKG